MSTAVEHADVPSEFGRGLSACINCRLVKTFDQVCHFAIGLISKWSPNQYLSGTALFSKNDPYNKRIMLE